jgi:uncharacterized membrane protein
MMTMTGSTLNSFESRNDQARAGQSATHAHMAMTAVEQRPSGTDRATQWARGLGWFSIGLGLTELLAPRQLARSIGLHESRAGVLPWLGVRELVSGIGILAKNGSSAPWVRSRAFGDAIDLGLLGAAISSPRNDRGKLAIATAAVVGVTALDVFVGTGRTAAALRSAPRRITHSIAIQRPAKELYEFWRKLENLPRVLSHLQSVEQRAGDVSHWVAKAPLGTEVEWDAEIVEDVAVERIAWRSLDTSDIANRGIVTFTTLSESRGTLVTVRLDYDPPADRLGVSLLKVLGQAPEQQVARDLRRWKQLLETGEIATTEGQPSGRRTLVSRALP